jgi:rod shape-determining protein MreC
MRSSPLRSIQSVILALVIIGLIILALGGYLAPLTRVALGPVVSAQTWLSTRFQVIQNLINSPEDIIRLRQRNVELEDQVSDLQAEIIDLKQQLTETRILSALVDFARIHPENRYVAVSVIGRDPSPFAKYVIINRGSDDGLRRGMPVVTAQGLVGQITAITANAGRVQLITDPTSSVNVNLEGSGAQAVLNGSLTGELTLEMIPQATEVQPGNLVLTSGLGGNYPADLLVGQVTSVRSKETDLFQSAAVQPIVDFSNLEILLVIVNFQPIDIEPLIPSPAAP